MSEALKKIIFYMVLFIGASIILNLGTVKGMLSEDNYENVRLVVYLLIVLMASYKIMSSSIRNLFKGEFKSLNLLFTVIALALYFAGFYEAGCGFMLIYMAVREILNIKKTAG